VVHGVKGIEFGREKGLMMKGAAVGKKCCNSVAMARMAKIRYDAKRGKNLVVFGEDLWRGIESDCRLRHAALAWDVRLK